MLTRNNEIATSNSKGHWKGMLETSWKVLGWIFPFLFGQKGAPRDVEGIEYDIKWHQECQELHKKCWGKYGWKYFIFYIISHKGVLRTIGKHGSRKEDVRGHWKGPI